MKSAGKHETDREVAYNVLDDVSEEEDVDVRDERITISNYMAREGSILTYH